MDELITLLLIGLGIYVGYKILTKIGGRLVNWARAALRGIGSGLLAVAMKLGEIWAFAVALNHGRPDVVEEIEVDEGELSEDVLEALRQHGAVIQMINS